jgi:IclR family acetate operon transcriptional repressor
MGKAVLAGYSADEVAASIARRGARRFTAHTLMRRSALQAQMEDIRGKGYAIDDEEYAGGLRCIAAAVYDHQGEILCAISLSATTSRIPDERFPLLGTLVVETARELTSSLGGVMPS